MNRSRTGAYQLLCSAHTPPCKCVSVSIRLQLPSDVLKMHQSQTGRPELEGIHPRYGVYLVVVCCAGWNPFALIADVRDAGAGRSPVFKGPCVRETPHTRGQGAGQPPPTPAAHMTRSS